MQIEEILSRFPKSRPRISPAAAAVHEDILKANRERASPLTKISQALEAWMHRRAADAAELPSVRNLLEIGAGTLNHVAYAHPDVTYDVVEPLEWLYSDSPHRNRIRRFFPDITRISGAELYDCIISIAALEHLTDLPRVVAQSGLLLRPNGVLCACIPSEGGFAWAVAWRLTFAIAYKLKTGRDWSEHMRYEHLNTAPEIIAIVRYFFSDVAVSRFPLPHHHLSLYASITARRPRRDICEAYLANSAPLTAM
jgi:SAM-dependent methyltransferase